MISVECFLIFGFLGNFAICMVLLSVSHKWDDLQSPVQDTIADCVYVARIFNSLLSSIMTILMYEFLFSLKKVETQLNSKYNTVDKVFSALKKQIRFQRFLIFINIVSDLSFITLFATTDPNAQWVMIVFGPLHIVLNAYMLYIFLKMNQFFSTMLTIVSEKQKRKYKFFICFVITIFILTQIRFFLYSQIWQLIQIIQDDYSYGYDTFIILPERILSYVAQLAPVSYATLMVFLIAFFGSASKDDYGLDSILRTTINSQEDDNITSIKLGSLGSKKDF